MKTNNKELKAAFFALILFLTAGFMLPACQQNTAQQTPPQSTEISADVLAQYFEQNGNYINSAIAPAIISAADVYKSRSRNIKLIDLRPIQEFDAGHIEGAVNIQVRDFLKYYTKHIDAMAFDTIVLACDKGQTSGYVTGIMRLLGYNNTFSMRFGMSSWNSTFGNAGWDKSIGNELVGKLETSTNPKPAAANYPSIQTMASLPFAAAIERADTLLSKPSSSFLIDYKAILDNPGKYFVINYWPEEKYLNPGHLPGAVQYTPKKSLLTDAELNTLPLNQPIAVYCFTGQHSANVVAYLKMLGYDAYSVKFGSNAFINQT
ncbi:MAG: hypothetical protein K8F24_10635, partial [Bacteroidales bacterium]|nr:hypothetical protein [Bacteroidales bacterium]